MIINNYFFPRPRGLKFCFLTPLEDDFDDEFCCLFVISGLLDAATIEPLPDLAPLIGTAGGFVQ